MYFAVYFIDALFYKKKFMKKTILSAIALLLALATYAQPKLGLELYASGFNRPVDIVSAGDERLFIVQQNGIIRIIDGGGQVLPTPFLNIDPRVNSTANERGLLGLVFHPNYAENGYFYVNYTNNSGDTHISRFSVSASDPNIADPDSESILIVEDQPFSNHNAGDLNFGPDGYLYFGLGDGGSGGDPNNLSQNRQRLLGKMIRIDVDNGNPYAIPPTNPYVNSTDTLPEIWAFGLRNPWRFSFDRLTGDMWIADVGQDAWEEIDFQPASSTGGENYGWRCYEGLANYNTSGCGPQNQYVPPIHVYANTSNVGCSVTGGFVYRGSDFPDLDGYYIYTDYCSGRIWSLRPDTQGGGWTNELMMQGLSNQYSTFGENQFGELFLAGLSNGNIYRVVEQCQPFQVTGTATNVTCPGAGDGTITLEVTNNTMSYTVAWNTGDTGNDISGLAAGAYTVTATNNIGCSRTLEFNIVEPDPPFIELSADGAELTSSAGFASYVWLLNGAPVDTTQSENYTATVSGDYSVEVTDASGCTFSSGTVSVVVSGISEAELGLSRLVLSPNPFVNTLRIEMDAAQAADYRFRLLDTRGQMLLQWEENVARGWRKDLDLSQLPAGMYLLGISANGKELVKKVKKQ